MLEVYTSSNCPNCKALKAKLQKADIEFVERNTDDDDVRLHLYMIGRCTVPSVVLDGKVLENEEVEKLIHEEV